MWSKIAEVTNADAADVALLSRMEAGARLNAALPPESKEILHSLKTLAAAPVRRSAIGDFAGIGNASLVGQKGGSGWFSSFR